MTGPHEKKKRWRSQYGMIQEIQTSSGMGKPIKFISQTRRDGKNTITVKRQLIPRVLVAHTASLSDILNDPESYHESQ